MRRLHQDDYCRATFLLNICNEEDVLTAQINKLESTPLKERNTKLIARLRQERADLIARNISRY